MMMTAAENSDKITAYMATMYKAVLGLLLAHLVYILVSVVCGVFSFPSSFSAVIARMSCWCVLVKTGLSIGCLQGKHPVKFLFVGLFFIVAYLVRIFPYVLIRVSRGTEVFKWEQGLVLPIIMSVIIGPFVEEWLMRKCIYFQLRTKFGIVVSMLSCSAIFFLAHISNTNIFSGIDVFVGSIVLCFIFEKTKRWKYCYAAHAGFNLGLLMMCS
jgi:membrane protease YdiL (CAAX protease family)